MEKIHSVRGRPICRGFIRRGGLVPMRARLAGEARRASRRDLPATPFGGFTLIEVVVVLAIVIILARLLMPVVGKAKMSAHGVVCANNLRQLGLAFQQYTMDWGCYPASADTKSNALTADWVRVNVSVDGGGNPALQPGCKVGTVPWSCSPMGTTKTPLDANGKSVYRTGLGNYANPSDKPCRNTIYWCPIDPSDKCIIISYSMNAGLLSPHNTGSQGKSTNWGLKPSWVKHPAGTYLLFEERSPAEEGYDARDDGNFWCWKCVKGGSMMGDKVTRRHNGGSNILFCDGHVGWAKTAPADVECEDLVPGTIEYDIHYIRGCWPDPFGPDDNVPPSYGQGQGDATTQ